MKPDGITDMHTEQQLNSNYGETANGTTKLGDGTPMRQTKQRLPSN